MADLGDLTPNDVKRIADSPTVRRLSRVISIALLPLLGGGLTYFFTLDHRVASIEVDRASRIISNDARLAGIEGKIIGLQADTSKIKVDVSQTALDVAQIKGTLQEMQRQQNVADLLATRPRDGATLRAPAR